MMNDILLSRRSVIPAAGLGALALAGLARPVVAAAAPEWTDLEKKNVAVVDALMKALGDDAYTPEKMLQFFTEDCFVRMVESRPPVNGHAALVAEFRDFMFRGGNRFGVETYQTFAYGPLVANSRHDWFITPDKKKGRDLYVAGYFILKDGKIKEYADLLTAPPK
jgi:limonene-1,2-epoxide hydrolase